MKKILLLPLLVLISCSSSSPQKTALPTLPTTVSSKTTILEQDNAVDTAYEKFNDHYKQALFLTNQSNAPKAKEFFLQAKSSWDLFFVAYKNNQPDIYTKTTEWENKLISMDTELQKAGEAIEKNELLEAHEHLEKVRIVWFAIRKENGMKTFSDDLFTLHESMEETLLSSEKESFIQNFTQLKADALVLQKNPPTLKDEAETNTYRQLYVALEMEIAKMEKAIQENNDFQAIKTSASGIKPAFTKLYLQFG